MTMTEELRALDVPVADVHVRGRRIEGYAALYGAESRDLGGFREVIEAGAFREVLAGAPDVVATFNHSADAVLGRTTAGTLRLEDRADGLWFAVELPDSPLGQNVREMVRRGDAAGCSFRFVVERERWDGEVRHVEAVRELRDVSVATHPAYDGPRVELRSRPEQDDTTTPGGRREEEDETMRTDERTAGGGLAVEDRTAAAEPSVETRVLDALRGVRKGEARSLDRAGAAPVEPADVSTFLWDRLRPRSIALASGVRVITTDRQTVSWPRLTADVDPTWVAEGAVIPEGDPAFGTLTARPRKLAHRIEVTNEALDDSDPSLADVLTTQLATMLALKLDRSIFLGSGAGEEIRGLASTPGIQTVSMGANGGAFTNLDPIVDALGLLAAANVAAPFAIAMAPRTWTSLLKLKEATGSAAGLLSEAYTDAATPRLFGAPVYVSSQLPVTEAQGSNATASSVWVYAPSEVVLVRRQDVAVELDRSRLFDRDMSEYRGTLRADLLVPNPQAVVRIAGVTP